ncbi:MAG: NUDIX domain-containing protein [Candidatus Woesearchaeota archaeon]|jgi:isopentenyldiphosphate isomerase
MVEKIDVVDERDRVIGKALRSMVHKKRLRHRRVAVLIFMDDSYQHTLIQKRSKMKDVAPGKWAHLEGHILAGESYLQGAKREIEEEMFQGKTVKLKNKLELLFKLKSSLDQDQVFLAVYRTILNGPFKLQKEEVAQYKFIRVPELVRDIKAHPRKYTETARAVFIEYAQEFYHGRRNH